MHTTNSSSDIDQLQGLWKPYSAVLAGQAMPDVVLEGMSLEISGTEYTVVAAGMTDKGTLAVDDSFNPKQMLVQGTQGPNKGNTLTAIYKFENQDIIICYDLTGQSYPKDFSSDTGTQIYLVKYRNTKS